MKTDLRLFEISTGKIIEKEVDLSLGIPEGYSTLDSNLEQVFEKQQMLLQVGLSLFESLEPTIQAVLKPLKDEVYEQVINYNLEKAKELVLKVTEIYPNLQEQVFNFILLLAETDEEKLYLHKQIKSIQMINAFNSAFLRPVLVFGVYFLPKWRDTYAQVMAGLINKADDYEVELDVITVINPLTHGSDLYTKLQFTEIYESLFDVSDGYYVKRRALIKQISDASTIDEVNDIIINF